MEAWILMCQISMYYHESWPKILRYVNDEGFSILEKTALGKKYFIEKVVSVNTIFFNVFYIVRHETKRLFCIYNSFFILQDLCGLLY